MSGWQSRPSGGRDKDERRDPFRRAKREKELQREKERRQEGKKEQPIRFREKDAAPRSEILVRCILVLRYFNRADTYETEENLKRCD